MGYRGKLEERNLARDLRAQGWTYNDIVGELGVSKSSVSLWCRDVPVDEAVRAARAGANRNRGARNRRPNRLQLAKQAEIEECRAFATSTVGPLSDRDLLVAGAALYAGEGFKTGSAVGLANTDPRLIAFFLRWLRGRYDVDESRLRVRLYLHEGLDLDAANRYWSRLTAIPLHQFGRPYRAIPDASRRAAKHPMGCATVRYSSVSVLRSVLALVDALVE